MRPLRSTWSTVLFLTSLVLSVAPASVAPASAGLFGGGPEPELLYTGSAPGLTEGVLVIRDAAEFATAVGPLVPSFGAEPPDFETWAVLRVVGRPRENSCRDTALIEVSTRGRRALVRLEERIPPEDCPCGSELRAPRVYLVGVTRSARYADVEKTDVVVPCQEGVTVTEGAEKPSLVFEGSWDASPGGRVIVDEKEYRDIVARLGVGDRAPNIDFERHRIVAVTGRPRENGCRRTRVVAAAYASKEEAVFEVEESYPAAGQMCTQIFGQPKLFLYRVPASVMRVRVVTREMR